MMDQAANIGPATVALIEAIMKAKLHPEPRKELWASARRGRVPARGNDVGSTTYGSIASILKHGLDKAYAQEATPDAPPFRHGNIRGSNYYH
jgi:hypothetical protein